MELIVAILLVLLLVLILRPAGRLFRRVTIYEYQRGLRYRDGKFVGLVGPGRYWIYRPSTVIQPVDVRETVLTVPGQEVISADGFSIKISLAARYKLADPARAVNEIENFTGALYTILQIALREVAGGRPIEALLQQRDAIGAELLERATPTAGKLGVELLDLDVKDFMFPASTRRVFAQVVEARQEGLAALEKARGETATLRNLSNAARLVEERPALMQLRLMQRIGDTTGNTVILGMPASSTPIPLRGDRAIAPPEPPSQREDE